MLKKGTVLSGIAAMALAAGVVAQSSSAAVADPYDYYHHHYHHYHHYPYYHYPRYYRHHYYYHDDDGVGLAVGAGILGLAIGSALAPRQVYYGDGYYPAPPPAYAPHYGHVARCEAHYRTYDPRTDTFVGYDGRLHYCRL